MLVVLRIFNYFCTRVNELTSKQVDELTHSKAQLTTMTIAIVTLMLLGYLLICTEHITRINKATVALFCGVWGWVLYI